MRCGGTNVKKKASLLRASARTVVPDPVVSLPNDRGNEPTARRRQGAHSSAQPGGPPFERLIAGLHGAARLLLAAAWGARPVSLAEAEGHRQRIVLTLVELSPTVGFSTCCLQAAVQPYSRTQFW